MPKWRDIWREITAEAECARDIMVRDREEGEEEFRSLIKRYDEDGMILLMRGQAYERMGELQLALADYRHAEILFPMQEWQHSARQAAAKVEAGLPAQARGALLKRELDTLELDDGVRKAAEEAFQFADLSPAASIESARSTLIALSQRLGRWATNERGALRHNYLEQAIRDLEAAETVSRLTAAEMHAIRAIRNTLIGRRVRVTSHDAKACAYLLMAVLRAACPIPKR